MITHGPRFQFATSARDYESCSSPALSGRNPPANHRSRQIIWVSAFLFYVSVPSVFLCVSVSVPSVFLCVSVPFVLVVALQSLDSLLVA